MARSEGAGEKKREEIKDEPSVKWGVEFIRTLRFSRHSRYLLRVLHPRHLVGSIVPEIKLSFIRLQERVRATDGLRETVFARIHASRARSMLIADDQRCVPPS